MLPGNDSTEDKAHRTLSSPPVPEAPGQWTVESPPQHLSPWPLSPSLPLEPPCSLHRVSAHTFSFSRKAYPKVPPLRSAGTRGNTSAERSQFPLDSTSPFS